MGYEAPRYWRLREQLLRPKLEINAVTKDVHFYPKGLREGQKVSLLKKTIKPREKKDAINEESGDGK